MKWNALQGRTHQHSLGCVPLSECAYNVAVACAVEGIRINNKSLCNILFTNHTLISQDLEVITWKDPTALDKTCSYHDQIILSSSFIRITSSGSEIGLPECSLVHSIFFQHSQVGGLLTGQNCHFDQHSCNCPIHHQCSSAWQLNQWPCSCWWPEVSIPGSCCTPEDLLARASLQGMNTS